MKLPFSLVMAWRESRRSRKRLALYMASVSLGVAALVAINSFSANVSAAVSGQAKTLLGADLEMRGRNGWTKPVADLLDSLSGAGVRVSHVTSFGSMVLARRNGHTRLFEVRAVEGAFPYYGSFDTDPPGLWSSLQTRHAILVDPAVLIQLDAKVGDTLSVGDARFPIAGVVTGAPGDIGLRTAIGPRVFMPATALAETNLLRFGSRAQYRAYLEMPVDRELQRFLNRHNRFFRTNNVGYSTAADQEQNVSDILNRLARYLGLVGLIALLLGGIGVASAVHVFVKEKLDTAALLRCLGARQRSVLTIYLLQAVALGFFGSAVGVVLGIAVQAALPHVVRDFLPLDVAVSVDWVSALAGLGVGAGTAAIFALLPLLALRDVTPLRALRHEFDSPRRRLDIWRLGAYALLGAAVLLLSIWQAPFRRMGYWFAGAVAGTTLLLWLTALALMFGTRRFFPSRARYVVRQGIANLFRPQNQTVAVILAIGFGVFLIATLYVVQKNLLSQFALDTRPDRPNLALFDIQTDQKDGVLKLLRDRGITAAELAPIVPGRISRIKGLKQEEIKPDSLGRMPARWAMRREYRNTYRDTLVAGEEIVAGEWDMKGGRGGRDGSRSSVSSGLSVPSVSVEEDLAHELGVWVGDNLTWDVQGVSIETRVTSIRKVTWARFQPNFFVVFQPGVLERAPQMMVTLTRVADATKRAELERDLVMAYPNISALDLTLVQQALDGIVSKASLAIRFMALFSIACGAIILVGALATSRFQRVREAVLLKTLGAGARQIRQILLTEYFAWGSLAALTGVLLSAVAAWALVKFLFELQFTLPWAQLALVWAAVCGLTTVIGFANSGEVLRRTPLAVLREMSE